MSRISSAICSVGLCALLATTAGCSNPKTIDGITYGTYGVANEQEKMNPNIEYQVCMANVFWAVVFSETIVVPVLIIGWDLYEPIGRRDPNAVPGQLR